MFPAPLDSEKCERWAVLTSIFEPTDTVRQLGAAEDWCVVVVGDQNGGCGCGWTWCDMLKVALLLLFRAPRCVLVGHGAAVAVEGAWDVWRG